MPSGFVIRKNQYYDSVFLMSVNRRISEVKGVQQTAVLMGSPTNKLLLQDIGVKDPQIETAQPNDLIVAVIANTTGIVEDVLGRLDEWLNAVLETTPITQQLRSFKEGLAIQPNANLAVISVPGEYAAREGKKALEAGLNIFMFSDNVSIEQELKLKELAARQGLLVMGPDCGTSLIGGVGIGFANAVRKGSIGVIGAAGTGLQEFTSQVHNAGQGISHAIGTGSHDLSDQIGGLTTFAALEALEADAGTRVISMVSKPPAPATLERLLSRIETCHKPVIGCFLGTEASQFSGKKNFKFANNIDEAVGLSIGTIGVETPMVEKVISTIEQKILSKERTTWLPEQRYLRGILAGGTFCYQSQQILKQAGIIVHSNKPFDPNHLLEHPDHSLEHTIVDMGDDFYMVGKPHPMIDGSMRSRRIISESQDPQVAILLLDFILGYNASMDPVGDLADAIQEARNRVHKRGGALTVVTSICGTEGDPQDVNLQMKLLKDAGAIVYRSNYQATVACHWLLGKGQE